MTEVAVPLQVRANVVPELPFLILRIALRSQDAIGDGMWFNCSGFSRITESVLWTGWMYTLWAGLMLIAGLLVLSVLLKGESWRHAAELREEHAAEKADQ